MSRTLHIRVRQHGVTIFLIDHSRRICFGFGENLNERSARVGWERGESGVQEGLEIGDVDC